VCEALTDHDDVDATDIEVTVKNGEVALTGVVEDRYMKRLAEECVERVSGVRDVHNQLRIRDGRT
jgi:osmotically-inducible protein OsmY